MAGYRRRFQYEQQPPEKARRPVGLSADTDQSGGLSQHLRRERRPRLLHDGVQPGRGFAPESRPRTEVGGIQPAGRAGQELYPHAQYEPAFVRACDVQTAAFAEGERNVPVRGYQQQERDVSGEGVV